MVFNLSDQNSIANQFMAELRDREIQTDRMKFRKNLERLGQIMAYEISKNLIYEQTLVTTPLGTSNINLMVNKPVLLTVMRAGLPYFQGFLDYFDQADSGFIGAYRKEGAGDIVINLEYVASPSVEGRIVILVDPMLATGKSIVRSVEAIDRHGSAAHIHIACIVAVQEGIDWINNNLKVPHSIWSCAIDSKLDERSYIVPGLGDAGDLCFGGKM